MKPFTTEKTINKNLYEEIWYTQQTANKEEKKNKA